MKINAIILTILLAMVNIAHAEWFTVTTSGLPQNLIVNQQYQNVSLTLTNTTTSTVNLTTAVTAVPKGFPSNSTNTCESVELAPKQSCVLASAAIYTPSAPGDSLWSANVSDGFGTYYKTVTHPVANGVDAVIVPLPKNASVGQKIPVQINVENRGTTAAQGFVVDLPKLSGLVYNENTCDAISILDPAQHCTITGTYTPPTGTTGDVSLKATVEYNEGAIIKLSADTFIHAIAIQGSVSPSTDNVSIGQPDHFAFSFRNTNTTTAATGVSVALPTAPGLSVTANNCSGTLDANSICTVQMEYIPAVGSQGLHTFSAILSYDNGNDVVVTHNSNISAIPVTGTLSSQTANVYIGGTDTFTYTFTNTSTTAAATDVSVTIPSDPELTITNDTCGVSIAAHTSCNVTAAYKPTEGTQGEHVFTAVLRYGQGGDVVLSHKVSVNAVTVNGSVSPTTANVVVSQPETFTYTFNNTTGTAATGVSLVLPAEIADVLVKGTDTCSSDLPANSGCSVSYTYTPPADAEGEHDFTAVLSYAEGGDVVLTHKAAVSTVAVRASVTPASNVAIGQTDTFQYTYTNTSATNAATGISIIYSYDPNLKVVNSDCDTTLAANSSCTVTLAYTPPVGAQGQHDFVAVFSYAEGGDLVSSHETTVSTVPVRGTLAVSTTNVPVAGTDIFTYTFTNTAATGEANNLQVVSPAVDDEGFTQTDNCTGQAIAAGGSCTVTGTYVAPANSQGQHSFPMIFMYDEGADVILTHTTNVTQADEASISGSVTTPIQDIAIGNTGDITYTFTSANVEAAPSSTDINVMLPSNLGVPTTDTCGTTLSNNASCTVTIPYTPAAGTTLGFHAFSILLLYRGDGGTLPVKLTAYANVIS